MTEPSDGRSVLVLNPGSATLKGTVLVLPDREPRFERTVDWPADASAADRRQAVDRLLEAARESGIDLDDISAVGYRVVHGGPGLTAPVVIDDALVGALDQLGELAPLHNPLAVATIKAGRTALPSATHVAAFDTAFHATIPEAGRRYPVPDAWVARGVRRYGFHGLSVAWSSRRAGELLRRPEADLRLVVAHLGGGCSVTAVDGGRSVDTSMGMTPLDGLMMGTRSGSIDPGILLRLLDDGIPLAEIADELEHRSGLLGVSGRSADMRELLTAAAAGDDAAAGAIELFVRGAGAGIAAAATMLPALDALVGTGGIGENAAPIREGIGDRLGRLGYAPGLPDTDGDADAVLASDPAVVRVQAREDLAIAEAASRLAHHDG